MTHKGSKVLFYLLFVTAVWTGAGQAQISTWTGGGGNDNWSTGDNWGGTAPVAGDALVFGGTVRCTNVNDLAADLAVVGMTFNSGSALFSLSGARLTLDGNVANNDNDSPRIYNDLILSGTRTFTMAGGSLYLHGQVSGSGGITTSGNNILVLAGDNSYEGVTTVSSGIVRLMSGSALGTVDGNTVVADGKRLELASVSVTGEVVNITGNGGNNNGALQVQAGSNTWGGKIILDKSASRIGVTPSNAVLVVTGVVDDGPNTYSLAIRNADNGGHVVLAGENTYGGETQFVVGKTVLSGGDNRLPTNTVLRLGNSSNVQWATLDLNGQNQTVAGILQEGSTMARKIVNWNTNQIALLTVNTWKTNYTYSANLDGNLNLVKTGPYWLALTASSGNTFNGLTTVSEGELVLQTPWAIMDSTVNTGDGDMGVLAFYTNTVINFGGLIGTNDLVLTNRTGAAVSLRIRGNQNTRYDGLIVGGADFTKSGGGTFTLLNPASYTGKTYLTGGRLVVPSEDVLGVDPGTFVADQITFDGGVLKASSNFVFDVSNRGVTFNAGGGGFDEVDLNSIFTVNKQLVGVGGLDKWGVGTVLVTQSNTFEGVTTVNNGVLRLNDNQALGTTAGGTVIVNGGQLELENGVTVTGESLSLAGAGFTTVGPVTSPQVNRGALEAAVNATAEWAGPVLLTANQSRVGTQNGGHLVISGVIDDGAATYQLRTGSNPGDRVRGTEFKAHNTYGGSTDLTRGTLFLGISDAIPAASVLDVHWAEVNNNEYAALDVKGFDQTLAGLKNTGNTGANAAVTNSAATLSTLTVNQVLDTSYNGVIGGMIALVKEGVGRLSLGFSTCHSGSTTVRGGTLLLGTNNVLSSVSPVVLDGGTLDAGSATNILDSLTVTGNSSIELGTGEIGFINQGAAAWNGQLELTGTLGPTSLRFLPALTADQVSRISYNGGLVMQNEAGYIVEYFGTLILLQ